MNFSALRSELDGDLLERGYSTMDDQEAADSLNTENREVHKEAMTGSEVLQAVDTTEYSGLGTEEKDAFWGLLGIGMLDPWGVEAQIIVQLFGVGSETVTALQAARVETVSRAVELGLGFVRASDVMKARAL